MKKQWGPFTSSPTDSQFFLKGMEMNINRRFFITTTFGVLTVATIFCISNMANGQEKPQSQHILLESFNNSVLLAFESLQTAVAEGDQSAIRQRLRTLDKALLKHQIALEALPAPGSKVQTVAAIQPTANFVSPPTEVQGVNHVLAVAVSPQLIKQRDVWVGVKPIRAPDQIWLQGSRIFTSKSNHNVYLGLKGAVNEKFEVLILSVPKGTFKSDGPFRAREVDKYSVEILASTVIHRTQ